jgi:hypothetical protein
LWSVSKLASWERGRLDPCLLLLEKLWGSRRWSL